MMFDHVDDLTLLDSGVRIHLVEDPQAWNMFRVAVSVVPISDQTSVAIRMFKKHIFQKHRKNCECCPGHYLIVDHYSSI